MNLIFVKETKMVLIKKIFLILLSINSLLLVNLKAQETSELFSLTLEELMNLKVITASRTEEKVSEIPASVVVISRADIEKYGYRDLQEIIENIPGFYITDERSNTDKAINVRGFWSQTASHVAILVDGVNQVHEKFLSYPISNIAVPIEAIERIEVVRGPMSVTYGSGAFFGVINIITTYSDKQNSLVTTTFGTNNYKKAFLRVSKKENDLQFTLNASYNDADGDNLSYNDLMSNPNDWGYNNKTTGTEPYRNTSKYFNFSINYKGFYSHLNYANSDYGFSLIVPPTPSWNQLLNTKHTTLDIGYNGKINKYFKFDINGYYTNSNIDQSYNVVPASKDYSFTKENNSTFEIALNFFYNNSKNMKIEFGGLFRSNFENSLILDAPPIENAINANRYLKDGDEINSVALFSEIDYILSEKIIFTVGVRLEKYFGYTVIDYMQQGLPLEKKYEGEIKEREMIILPRIAAIYKINESNVIKLLFGRATKQPSIASNSNILSFNSINNTNYPFLKEEEIQTFEINYLAILTSKITTNISCFYNMMDYLIARKFEIINNAFQSYTKNIGEYNTVGTEISVIWKPIYNMNLDFALSYQKTNDKNNQNIDVAFSPNLLMYLKVAYLFNKDYSVAIIGSFVDEMESYWNPSPYNPTDFSIQPIGRIGQKAESYFLFGINFRVNSIFTDGLFSNLKISNIFNTEIHYPTFTNNSWADKGMIGGGREILLTVGYKF